MTVATDERLRELTEDLLVRDAGVHAEAVAALADEGDERVVPHLFEVLVIDAIANDWDRFGFPEALKGRDPPRYLQLPEVRWEGAADALGSLAAPDFDSAHAWVEWESWYSQQDIEPLAGFDEWKLRLYRSYLPPVGALLDRTPRAFDLQDVRWGNCDRSFLAALNAPAFVPGDAVATRTAEGELTPGPTDDDSPERYLDDEDLVFGFEVDGIAVAVPRWVLFPHELMNTVVQGVPLSLTYCTLCNAPILYDRRVDGDVLTFGSSGMLESGNKVMYDEETETLWDQHTGTPTAGHYLETDPDCSLDQHLVTQTEWAAWRAEHPGTLALDIDTGYDYDYRHYEDDVGFFDHYWSNESVIQPGVHKESGELPEKESVYGITEGSRAACVIPRAALEDGTVIDGVALGEDVIAFLDGTDDVAVYEAPPTPVERTETGLVDAEGTNWTVTREALHSEAGATLERVPGRHGLWFAFRTHYDETSVLRP